MTHVSVTVNGVAREADVEPRTLLVYFLRETLGLTGTNVGCDTSSCGVVHRPASTASRSSRARCSRCRPTAGRSRRSRAWPTDGQLHPIQEAFHRNHGLQCGYCTPGMIMAAASYLQREPEPDRGAGARVARGQPLPLHRLPQHREVHPRRRRADERREGLGGEMAITEKYVGRPVLRKEDPELLTGQAQLRGQPDGCRAWCGWRWSAARSRTPRLKAIDVSRARGDAGRDRRVHGGGPRGRVGRTAAVRLADHRGHQGPGPLAAHHGQGPVRGRRRRRRRRRDPRRRPRTPPRLVDVRYEQLPVVLDLEEAAKDGASLVHEDLGTERRRALEPRRRRRPDHVRHRATCSRAAAVPRPEADPRTRSSRAACLASVVPAMGEFTLISVDADPAHREGDARRARPASPSPSSGSSPPTSGGGVRLEAERLRGGGALPGARAPDWTPGEVDRGRARRTTSRRSTGAGVIHDVELAATRRARSSGSA